MTTSLLNRSHDLSTNALFRAPQSSTAVTQKQARVKTTLDWFRSLSPWRYSEPFVKDGVLFQLRTHRITGKAVLAQVKGQRDQSMVVLPPEERPSLPTWLQPMAH